MPLITCHAGKLLTDYVTHDGAASSFQTGVPGLQTRLPGFRTGLAALDALAPGGAFARGAVHELLADPADGQPRFIAMLLARAAASSISCSPSVVGSPNPLTASDRSMFWLDPSGELYPPALARLGIALDRLFLLTGDLREKDWIWAATEALGCRGVGAVVFAPAWLSRIAARKLQLAAERGGSVGLLLRQTGRSSAHHAAATRWLIRLAPGERNVQRWTLQLLHGHGGRIGQTVCLEHCRETNHLHSFAPLAHRPASPRPRHAVAS